MLRFLAVSLCLEVEEFRVASVESDKFLVRASFDDLTVFEDEDTIGQPPVLFDEEISQVKELDLFIEIIDGHDVGKV